MNRPKHYRLSPLIADETIVAIRNASREELEIITHTQPPRLFTPSELEVLKHALVELARRNLREEGVINPETSNVFAA